MSNDGAFSESVQRVIASQSDRFTDLVRASGLRPESDFRHADLSGADLRGEDLRKFDLSNACLHGALIAGALFNRTVSKRQLAEAEKSSRAVVAMIGERLLALEEGSQKLLGPDLVVPKQFVTAARMVGWDQARRHREKGVHLGDSSDLAHRRMSQPFRLHDRTILNSRAAVVLFEPSDDLDFDSLSAVLLRFGRANKNPIVLLVPSLMESDSTGQAILRARLRNLSPESVLNLSRGMESPDGARRDTLAEHARRRGLEFLAAIARSQAILLPPLHQAESYGQRAPWLLDGSRSGRHGLYSSITSDLQKSEDDLEFPSSWTSRRHIFIRQDLYDKAPAETLVRTLTPRLGSCALSVFPPSKKSPKIEYYVLTAPPFSPIWSLTF